jgi:REP element-mobilizing transposase RayT
MARQPRPLFAGAIYHVTARGNRGQEIVRDDADRHVFRSLLADAVQRHGWRVLAWCLLGNHYHLLVETPKPNLSAGMHKINGEHARRFNRRHGFSGHLFQGRFHSTVIDSDEYLFATSRYIAHNPVAAGLVKSPSAWPWSSHPATVGGYSDRITDTGRLTELFGAHGGDGHQSYADFVDAALAPRVLDAGAPQPKGRPTVLDLIVRDGFDAGSLVAVVDHGYTLREIAEATGRSASFVRARIRSTARAG